MLKWFSADEPGSSHGAPGSPLVDTGTDMRFSEITEQLTQMQELVAHLKELIREKDAALGNKDGQVKELTEQMQHLRSERENFQSKLEAERHITRARLRDLMEKHEAELLRVAGKHEAEMSEKEQALRRQLETLQRSISLPADASANQSTCITSQRVTELQAQIKLKDSEVSKAEAKFLKMKAWSKSRIRQLEQELKKVQSGVCLDMSPDITSLHDRITELQEDREEMLSKLEQYEDMKAKNDELQRQLMEYKEQQRKMQADLEQVTKRAASQVSETGSMDDVQVMEWQEMVTMVTEAERVRDQGHEKNVMSFRMSHIEEEREALANRQQEVEEELAQAHGQKSRKPKYFTPHSLQEDLDFHNRQDHIGPTDCDVNGENMGGWWPQHSTAADTDGLRSVVEELELERNQLQEQILVLEKQCQDLEDRRQLQARIELLQNESERLQAQVVSLRSQQIKDAEKHQLLITSLNKQLKGLSSTQECLESSLMEKEHTLARTSEKLECIDSLREALETKEKQHQDTADKLLQTEHNLAEVKKTCSTFEKENSEIKATVAELTLKLSVLKDKMQKQEATIESLQSDLVQTNDDLDRLNIAHLEERAQLVHDLQSCEREIDRLQDVITDKDKEILALSSSTAEYSEQIHELKQEMKLKEDVLAKVEQDVQIFRDPQLSDQQFFNVLIPELIEQLKRTESDLKAAKKEGESKSNEIRDFTKKTEEDKKTIQDLLLEIQKMNMNPKDHLLNKEQVHEKEFLKEEHNKLLGEVSKHKSELLECQEQLKQDVQDKSKIIFQLEQKLKAVQEEMVAERARFNKEIKIHNEAKEHLEKDLSCKMESFESVNSNNKKLQESLEQHSGELARQKQLLDNAKEEIQAVQDQNSNLLLQVNSLTNDNCQLKREVEISAQSLSDDSEEKKRLISKISEVELQLLKSVKTIEDLQREKEELAFRGTELNKELEQNKQSMAEILLEKDAVVGLHETLSRQTQQLQEMFEEKQKEVLTLTQVVSEMNSKVALTLKENEELASKIISLDEQNKYLQKQMNEQMKSLTETTKERETLKNKILIFETQDVENRQIIEGLLKHKEDLLLQVEEYKVIQQKQQSGAEALQEKSSECAALSQCLTETKEEVNHLRRELESSTSQVILYNNTVLEKEKILTDQRTQLEVCQNQLKNLQDRLSILQQQANEHKSGLTEKDTLLQKESNTCLLQQKELSHERELVFTLRQEINSLKADLDVKESTLREKNLECHNHSEELYKRNESLLSLTSQLGIMNTNILKLESDNANLKDTLERHSTENVRLNEELRQKQNEVVEYQDSVQAMNEQNIIIKSELKNSMGEIFRQQEMITSLQNELASKRVELASLAEQLKLGHSQLEALQLTLQEKEDVFRMQEMYVNKMQVKLLESEDQITQKITMISELHEETQNLQTALQDKDVLLLNKDKEFSQVKTTLLAQSEACEARLKIEMGVIAKFQGELQNLQEKNNHLISIINEKDSLLTQEKERYLCLQSTASELENTISQLNFQIEQFNSEITQLREKQTEKELITFAAQSQMQKLDELYKKLQEEYHLTKQELLKVNNEKSLKEEEVCKLVLEKEEICRNSSYQIQRIQDQVQQHKWQSSTVNEVKDNKKMESEERHILESMTLQGKEASPEHWVQLHGQLQHYQLEIQKRESGLQQLNIKLQQAILEKEEVSTQLSTVSKMLKDTQQTVSELQNRCYWLERQFQNQHSPTQGSVYAEVPPGAPQEPIRANFNPNGSDGGHLRTRLAEAEFHLSQLNSRLEEERSRREAAEEAMRLTEERIVSIESKQSQRDFRIQLETEEQQYEELILRPSRHPFLHKMKSGVHRCQRLLKGRSIYCFSKLLTSRSKSRYIFIGYLLMLHVLVFVCLSWSL